MKTARRDVFENVGCLKGYGISREIRKMRMIRKVKEVVLEGAVWTVVMAVAVLIGWAVLIGAGQILIMMGVA